MGCSSEKTSVKSSEELSSEDINYILDKMENSEGFSKGLRVFSETLGEVAFTNDWVSELILSLGVLQTLIDDARKLEPPNKFKSSHEYYMKAIDEIQIVVDELPDAIIDLDERKMNSLAKNMENGNKYLEMSTEEFNSIKEKYGYNQ